MDTLMKRIATVLGMVRFGSSGPGAIPEPRMDLIDAPLTRQRLNDLLRQSPVMPNQDAREPVQLS